MFTGIVEYRGSMVDVTGVSEGRRLVIDAGPLAEMPVGGSISVNGVCLTAVSVDGTEVTVEVVKETLSRTNLGEATVGDTVNLERPLAANGRFDGHIVQGHVDGVGTVVGVVEEGNGRRLVIAADGAQLRYIVEKGSVAVDGVSLTVARLDGDRFEIALIPHTLELTNLGLRSVGDRVNLEVDILAKYAERMLRAGQ